MLSSDGHSDRRKDEAASLLFLPLLLFCLPFEPRRPTLGTLGLEFTLLEILAGATMAVSLWCGRRRVGEALQRLPVLLLFAYAAAHLLSAALAPTHAGAAAKFAMRMAAAALFGLAVAVWPREAQRRALPALAAGAGLVALLCILEGAGVRSLDPFLNLFRPYALRIGEVRRSFGASENPNLAAALLVYGLVAVTALAGLGRRTLPIACAGTALLSTGLLFTQSRGGLGAALVALAAVSLSLRGRSRGAAGALAALGVLLGVTAVFAALSPSFGLRVSTEATASRYGVRYEPEQEVLALAPGEERTIRVRVTNTGRQTWRPGQVFLAPFWYEVQPRLAVTWESRARPIPMPRDVTSGESLWLEGRVVAPRGEGRYLLVWELSDGTSPFSLHGVDPGIVAVWVNGDRRRGEAFTFAGRPGVWGRGRLELWQLALAMWRDRPLTGVGSDNFRLLNARYGGWVDGRVRDASIRAHNAFLEAAATTGALGLLALLATLLAAARAARHRLRAPAEALDVALGAATVGWLAGIVVQSMVDVLLPFTAHYLFLGFVVGVASSRGREAT
ncbi:MAG TPA: O-antigen ligase family protein [Vicinamibacteria bacterium]|nr:O-antigen ligase family protein [Vicinamibacteria bacterium]